jgi:4-amino-4-deoxy-L-arabinose transferase-like glycosyltransferase
LLLSTFFKGLVWAGVVPLWHFPDEQAHFAQLQIIAEGRFTQFEGSSTSREIYESEMLLGTFRNEKGNNLFTFHPEYNIPYTDSFWGVTEGKINALPLSSRKETTIAEATGYPILYYSLGAIPYLLFYQTSLFTRVFAVRCFSVLVSVATVWFAYKIGKIVFKKELPALTLGILVSFQPMFTFVGSGVNSDVMLNFFFTMFIWACLLVFEKPNLKHIGLVILSLGGGLFSKSQMAVAAILAIVPLTLALRTFLSRRRKDFLADKKMLFVLVGATLFAYAVARWGRLSQISGFILAGKERVEVTLGEHLAWTLRHTIAEVLPWYWGVFKWLGVVLPRWVNRIQMRLLLIGGLGLAVWLVQRIRQRSWKRQDWYIVWLGVVAGAYFFSVTLWNWQFRIAYGFPFGVQGRYFFPTIVAHMALIIVGLTSLVPRKLERWLLALLSGWWLVLSGIGLYIVLAAYYQLWPLQHLWWQVSQYKPFWFKAEWWFVWIGLFGIALTGLIMSFIAALKQERVARRV